MEGPAAAPHLGFSRTCVRHATSRQASKGDPQLLWQLDFSERPSRQQAAALRSGRPAAPAGPGKGLGARPLCVEAKSEQRCGMLCWWHRCAVWVCSAVIDL